MPRRIFIECEPLILKYARSFSGYDIATAALKLKIPEERLRLLEEQKVEISLAKVKNMANLYKIPLAYFLLQKVPKDVVIPNDFRIVYASEADRLSPDVMLVVRKARYVQSVIRDLRESGIEYNFKNVNLTDNIEEIANYFRSILGISMDEQRGWSDPALALRRWKDAVENLDIFVLQQTLPENDISAFCLADEKPYILVLNSSEHENRRIFSLFHEIGHILLHGSGVCTPNNFSRNSFDYIQIEKFCNQFAASVLVPIADFKANETVDKMRRLPFERWDPNDIRLLAVLYRVSQEVIYRRFVQVGILNERKYEQKRTELYKGFEEYKKRAKKKDVIIPQYTKIISRNGRGFTSLVLRSMYDNRITMSDVANFLGTTSRHISEVEAHL